MTRKLLIETLRKIVSDCGYAFHTGFAYRMESELKTFPAVWLLPPRVIDTEGRCQGLKKYGVIIHLVCNGVHRHKETCWSTMEKDVRTMYAALAQAECVKSVDALTCNPGEFSLTNRGELSLTSEFTVMMPFGVTQTEE